MLKVFNHSIARFTLFETSHNLLPSASYASFLAWSTSTIASCQTAPRSWSHSTSSSGLQKKAHVTSLGERSLSRPSTQSKKLLLMQLCWYTPSHMPPPVSWLMPQTTLSVQSYSSTLETAGAPFPTFPRSSSQQRQDTAPLTGSFWLCTMPSNTSDTSSKAVRFVYSLITSR